MVASHILAAPKLRAAQRHEAKEIVPGQNHCLALLVGAVDELVDRGIPLEGLHRVLVERLLVVDRLVEGSIGMLCGRKEVGSVFAWSASCG